MGFDLRLSFREIHTDMREYLESIGFKFAREHDFDVPHEVYSRNERFFVTAYYHKGIYGDEVESGHPEWTKSTMTLSFSFSECEEHYDDFVILGKQIRDKFNGELEDPQEGEVIA